MRPIFARLEKKDIMGGDCMTKKKVEKKTDKAAIMVDPYVGNTSYVDPDLLAEGWTRLYEESFPEYGGDFYIRNGLEIISKGLRVELKKMGYSCLAFRWPDTGLTNRLTFVFVPRSSRVGVTRVCVIPGVKPRIDIVAGGVVPGSTKLSYLRLEEQYPLIEVHQHRYGFGWQLSHGAISDVRDVTKFTPFFVMEPGYDRVSFTKNLPILKFLDPNYRKPAKRPKIIKEI